MDFEEDLASGWEASGPERPKPNRTITNGRPPTVPIRSQPANKGALRRLPNDRVGSTAAAPTRRWDEGPPTTSAKAPVPRGKPIARRPLDTARLHKTTPRPLKAPRQSAANLRPQETVEIDALPVSFDNKARGAWRRNTRPNGSFRLPYNYQLLYEKTYARPDIRSHDKQGQSLQFRQVLEQIGLQTGAYIQIPERVQNRMLSIWGTTEQVAAAKEKIDSWIQTQKKAAEATSWTRVSAPMSERMIKELDARMREHAFRERFRKDPEESVVSSLVQCAFLWPTSEIAPQNFLGTNFEALDPLRTSMLTYISWEPKRSLVKLLSTSEQLVAAVAERLRGIICEVNVRSSRPKRIHLIEPVDVKKVGREVHLIESDTTAEDRTGSAPAVRRRTVTPSITGPPPVASELLSWQVLRPDRAASNERALRQTILPVLSGLRYYRGHARARIRFGEPSLLTYMRPEGENYTLEEFSKMMRNSQVSTELIRELERDDGSCQLIERCRRATHLIDPKDPFTNTLHDVKAEYAVSFALSSIDGKSPLQLEVEFSAAPSGEYDVSAKRWFRRETVAASQNPLTERWRGRILTAATVLDLAKRTAWQFEVVVANHAEESRITTAMKDFASTIRLELPKRAPNAASAMAHARPRITFGALAITLRSQDELTHYRYRLKRSSCVLEVTRRCHVDYPINGAGKPRQETTWEACVYDLEWDTVLQRQSTLAIGERGGWQPTLATFFPRGQLMIGEEHLEDSFGTFLEEVKDVMEMLAIGKGKGGAGRG